MNMSQFYIVNKVFQFSWYVLSEVGRFTVGTFEQH